MTWALQTNPNQALVLLGDLYGAGYDTFIYLKAHWPTTRAALYLGASDLAGRWLKMPARGFVHRQRQVLSIAWRLLLRLARHRVPILPAAVEEAERKRIEDEHRMTLAGLRDALDQAGANAVVQAKIIAEKDEQLNALMKALAVANAPKHVEDTPTRVVLREQMAKLDERLSAIDRAILHSHGVDASKEQAAKDAITKAEAARKMLDEAQTELRQAMGLPAEEAPDPPVAVQPEQASADSTAAGAVVEAAK